MAPISLDKLTKRYGSTTAVDAADVQIASGELLVLLGPSGCGKTTTLRLIAGLESPTRGDVRIDGRPPRDADVGMVFQDHALYPHMTVRGNLRFAQRACKRSGVETQQVIDEVVSALNIADLLERKPHQLSGGQRQRVAVGRVLVRRPQVCLFDEPLSNLDATLRLEMRGILRALHDRFGLTTIHVTHDQEEAMALADRIAVMHRGRIEQVAAPLELFDKPASCVVASAIGAPPMNFLEGRIMNSGGVARFVERSDDASAADDAPPAIELASIHVQEAVVDDSTSVVLGVRPTAMRVMTNIEPGDDAVRLTARIDRIEQLGDHDHIIARTGGGQRLTVRADHRPDAPQPGAPIEIAVDPSRIHLFSPHDGRLLN